MFGRTLISSYLGMPETSLSRLQKRCAIDARCTETPLAA